MIIFDSSPLIHIAKIGKLLFIFNLFDYIIIAPAVFHEVIEAGQFKEYSESKLLFNLYNEKKIRIQEINKEDRMLEGYLHRGEYESVNLADELGYLLVVDDKKARLVAEQKGISFFTTADFLLLLLKEKKINYSQFRLNFAKYSENGWIKLTVVEKYLAEGKNYE